MKLKTALELIEPQGLAQARDAMAYGRGHSLSSRRRSWLRAYRQARRFGLHLLPDGLSLDGLVLDIGANTGEFTAAVRQLEPRSRVVAFEPAEAPRAALHARFDGDDRVRVDPRALSDRSGAATLNVSENTVFASLLPQRPVMAEVYAGFGTGLTATQETEMTPLDDVIDEPVRVLKIDVQGNEIAALNGAVATLQRTDAVLIEVLFMSHYEGDEPFCGIDKFLRDTGFDLVGITDPERLKGRAVWADACYARG